VPHCEHKMIITITNTPRISSEHINKIKETIIQNPRWVNILYIIQKSNLPSQNVNHNKSKAKKKLITVRNPGDTSWTGMMKVRSSEFQGGCSDRCSPRDVLCKISLRENSAVFTIDTDGGSWRVFPSYRKSIPKGNLLSSRHQKRLNFIILLHNIFVRLPCGKKYWRKENSTNL